MNRPLIIVACCAALLAACQPMERRGVALPESEWSSDRVQQLTRPSMATPGMQETEASEVPLPRRRPEQLAAIAPLPQTSTGTETEQDGSADMQIDQLVGLDFEHIRALLGFPALDEVQAPARVWAYNGSGCVLSIFFYPHVDGSTYRALTYEVKGGDDSAEFRNRCFAELVEEKAKEGT
ncbi:MAG: hypothetical protein ACFCUQ_15930 [Kiloniellales bacterium]